MEADEFFRVVNLRKSELRAAEFRLREGETGLSLFARLEEPSPAEVVEAVRMMGKRGNLLAAAIAAKQIRALGLTIVSTKGGTASAEVNAIHFEARLPSLRRLFLRLRGKPPHEYFNESFSQRLCEIARVLE